MIQIGPELASAKNPLGLQVGQQVRIRATCELEYNEEMKEVVRTECSRPCFIVGSCVRCTGEVIPGYHSVLSCEDDVPAYFKVSRRIRFYLGTYGMGLKQFLVLPDDIVLDS